MAPPCDTTELAVIQLACKIKQIDICPHRFNFKEEKDVCPQIEKVLNLCAVEVVLGGNNNGYGPRRSRLPLQSYSSAIPCRKGGCKDVHCQLCNLARSSW